MGKHKELSTEERNKVVQFLLQGCKTGKPAYGAFKEAAATFNITRQTVSRLWRTAKIQQQNKEVINSVSGKKSRAKRILLQIDYGKLQGIPLNKRGNQRKLAMGMGVSKTTIQRWYKMRLIRAHTSALRPQLTQDNKFLRIRFSLEALELDSILNRLHFSNMHNTVHIDEKWFYITKGSHRYYLAPEEEDPYRYCQSKKFIGKIIFICAVARPVLASNGAVIFDGKIGIFPFIDSAVALRNSKKRKKGTRYNKPVEIINRDVIKRTLLQKILSAIRQKWPEGASKNIQIQQDNAKPHIKDDDVDFRIAATQGGFNMHLVQQPPNSPDTNILDLGFFNAIQSLQHQSACTTLDDLVTTVVDAFYNISPETLNKVFLSLQGCLIEILKVKGQNTYKLPHMGKDALLRTGQLPIHLEVNMDLAREAIRYLMEAGQMSGLTEMGYNLGISDSSFLLDKFQNLEL